MDGTSVKVRKKIPARKIAIPINPEISPSPNNANEPSNSIPEEGLFGSMAEYPPKASKKVSIEKKHQAPTPERMRERNAMIELNIVVITEQVLHVIVFSSHIIYAYDAFILPSMAACAGVLFPGTNGNQYQDSIPIMILPRSA